MAILTPSLLAVNLTARVILFAIDLLPLLRCHGSAVRDPFVVHLLGDTGLLAIVARGLG